MFDRFPLIASPPRQRIQRGSGLALAAAIVAVAMPSRGFAQNWIDRDSKVELRRGDDPKPSDSKSGPSKDFSIELNLPVRYSNDVASSSIDSIIEKRGDTRVSPDLTLRWAHQYDWAKLSVEVGASTDRYMVTTDANLDNLYGTFKIEKTDGNSSRFVPYAIVTNNIYFVPTFHQTDITFHDVAAGFFSGIAWRDKSRIPYRDALIDYADADEPGDVAVKFDARVGRRISDQTDYQNTFTALKAELTYTISRNLRFEAATKFRASWYQNYFGDRRTDYRPGADVGLVWSPDWLKSLVKRSELSANFGIYRNYSNLPDKNYTIWDVGPSLSLRTKF